MQYMYQPGFASKMKQNCFYKIWSKPLNFCTDTSMALWPQIIPKTKWLQLLPSLSRYDNWVRCLTKSIPVYMRAKYFVSVPIAMWSDEEVWSRLMTEIALINRIILHILKYKDTRRILFFKKSVATVLLYEILSCLEV
jgi:hypothetical protein